VEFERHGVRQQATVEREVLLCAGAYGSPQILMLSGIGPGELASHGISPVHELPGVGQNLQEHVRLAHQYDAAPPHSFARELRFDRATVSFLRWYFTGTGRFANQIAAGCILARSEPDLDRPDLQIMSSPVRVDANIWFPASPSRNRTASTTRSACCAPKAAVRLRCAIATRYPPRASSSTCWKTPTTGRR
jgi:choline dehydrogenase